MRLEGYEPIRSPAIKKEVKFFIYGPAPYSAHPNFLDGGKKQDTGLNPGRRADVVDV
jgi:hypothetical protein